MLPPRKFALCLVLTAFVRSAKNALILRGSEIDWSTRAISVTRPTVVVPDARPPDRAKTIALSRWGPPTSYNADCFRLTEQDAKRCRWLTGWHGFSVRNNDDSFRLMRIGASVRSTDATYATTKSASVDATSITKKSLFVPSVFSPLQVARFVRC